MFFASPSWYKNDDFAGNKVNKNNDFAKDAL